MCRTVGYTYDKSTTTCIKLVKYPKSYWEDARETCRQEPRGDLVSITTKEKWDFIIKYLQGNKNIYVYVQLIILTVLLRHWHGTIYLYFHRKKMNNTKPHTSTLSFAYINQIGLQWKSTFSDNHWQTLCW